MRALIAAVVLVLAMTTAHATPAEELSHARDEFRAGHHAEAIPLLNYLLYPAPRLARASDLAEAHMLLGVCLFETGDRATAAREIDEVLYLDPHQALDPQLFSSEAIRFFNETKAAKEARDKAAADVSAAADLKQKIRDYLKSQHYVEKRQWWVNFMPFGAGQFQNGQTGKGILFAATEAAAAGTSIAIFAYLTNKYGYGGQVPKTDAASVRTLQQVAIGADVAFYGVFILGVVDAYIHYKPTVEIQGDDSLLPPELREPGKTVPAKKKPKSTSRLRLTPLLIPDGAGAALTWEH